MKLVRPLGVERVNDESEPYPSKGLRIPVDEMRAECTRGIPDNASQIKASWLRSSQVKTANHYGTMRGSLDF